MTEIDKNIPIPVGQCSGRAPKYPWYEMEVGDSFFMDARTPAFKAPDKLLKSGVKFTARKVDENGSAGVRVWRIK